MNKGVFMLIAFGLGFGLAQLIKCIIETVKIGGWDWRELKVAVWKAGGMPSGHTASLTAVAAYIGLAEGVSTTFALAVSVLMIVAYDAVNVRHAVGEHGKILKTLTTRRVRVVEGHTLLQVFVGGVIGVVVGAGVYALWRLGGGA